VRRLLQHGTAENIATLAATTACPKREALMYSAAHARICAVKAIRPLSSVWPQSTLVGGVPKVQLCGKSSDKREIEWEAMRERTALNQIKGSIPIRWQDTTTLRSTAAATLVMPKKTQSFGATGTPRLACFKTKWYCESRRSTARSAARSCSSGFATRRDLPTSHFPISSAPLSSARAPIKMFCKA
jgi:hypothetical protein